MSTHDYYKRLRTQLEIILVMLGSVLSTEESSEVGHFIDVGEYGLALETLSDQLIEENKKIPHGAYEAMMRAARQMGIEQQIDAKLEARVKAHPILEEHTEVAAKLPKRGGPRRGSGENVRDVPGRQG